MVNKSSYNSADLDAFMKIAASWQNNSIAEDFGNKNDTQNYQNSMSLYKKRERTQNWNHQEKKFLLELCRKDIRIIENKRLDAGLTAVKNKAWKIIHQKFSAAFGTDRTCNRLKEQWRRMKACTRNEIIDYNNRLARYGQETADRKKPSSFTFEIWDFMQEAKKQCKNENLDNIDYSKVTLALEEDIDDEIDHSEIPIIANDENENDMKNIQDFCDVRIKEEQHDDIDENDNRVNRSMSSPIINDDDSNNPSISEITNNCNNIMDTTTNCLSSSFNINNISATLETLNKLRNSNYKMENGHHSQQNGYDTTTNHNNIKSRANKRKSRIFSENSIKTSQQNLLQQPSNELKFFMEMQAKEHLMRMQILETQLQTAKYNRDIVEINKTIALQKLHDIANRRMS